MPARKSKFVFFYLTLLSVVFLLNGIEWWQEDETVLGMTGMAASIVAMMSLTGYMKGMKTLIWTGIILLSAFSLYLIAALVWTFTLGMASFFSTGLVGVLTAANLITAATLKKQAASF